MSVPCYKWIYFENTPSFAAYPKLPGYPLDSQYLSKNIGTLSSELGSFLSALHKIPISFPSLEIHRRNWKQKYEKFYIQVQTYVLDQLEKDLRDWVKQRWNRFLQDEGQFDFRPVWIHGDLSANHILINDRIVTGIIDWGDVGIGDPAFDLAALSYEFGEEWMKHVITQYTVEIDDHFFRRANFYVKIAPLHRLLYALNTRQPLQWEKGIEQLNKFYKHEMI
ncbi:phosphotransferase [Paenactinomyces guangxiensis]|uniref:Phosphotransferase n=1 Tax=Paenactinomyces guangxiensis TaxID=1490290 RepID=A0A7W1WSH1_9BACL|nr:phosphotransferase [Paenactinomyces guangxiensis]MBA4495163.1 phosphotransferase [Paenactinomyces guangxiensis]MBH8592153.1 phosphotransferase [Paenactinomyces guangxiensis]